MIIGDRIRAIREQKKLCQVDLAVRAGLLRNYLSSVEDGEAVPDVGTLDRIAMALEVPLKELFYDGGEAPVLANLPNRHTTDEIILRTLVHDRFGVGKDAQQVNGLFQSFRNLVASLGQKFRQRKRSTRNDLR
jgi:transcriptional regulator with XRE-family HTH domain